jgi:D-cysteine desulfhydrase
MQSASTATPRTPTADLALVRRYPAFADAFPRHPLTTLPTAVERLRRLEQAHGSGPLWIKRDDRSGPLYGGNKPRKLEWLVGDALQRGRRSVLTFGGIGTHHGLATAIAAADAGLRTILVLVPQPVTEHVRRNLLLDLAYGAEMHFVSSLAGAVTAGLRLLAGGRLRGDPPVLIPTGGTSARGALGYVNAAFELADQVRAGELEAPDWIFVPLGSGGTVAGLVLGLAMAGLPSRVAGVLVTDIVPPSAAALARLARSSARRLARACGPAGAPIGARDFTIVRDQLGRGYGHSTDEAEKARRAFSELEGIELETTYTAKCAAAFLSLAATEPYRGRNLLFWNTYSSIDPGARLSALPEFRALPPAFHRFFASA